jgi:hypothetical protein
VFGHFGFAPRYTELRLLSAKRLHTVENDREKFSVESPLRWWFPMSLRRDCIG